MVTGTGEYQVRGAWTSGTTDTTTSTTNAVWSTWVYDTNPTASSGTGCVWNVWVGSSATPIMYDITPYVVSAQLELTQEDLDAMEEARVRARREHEEMRARIAQRAKEQAEADAKAEELLLSLLNEEQCKEYSEKKQIPIFCGGEHPAFILTKERSYNVVELDARGKRIKRHCVQTVGVPLADQLAAQFLYIASGHYQELLAVANHQELR